MTTDNLNEILKSRPFKSTNTHGQSFIFTFTGVFMFIDGKYRASYDLSENDRNFFIKFSNVQDNLYTGDFKNILLVSDNIKEIINYDSILLKEKGKIEITLVGQ